MTTKPTHCSIGHDAKVGNCRKSDNRKDERHEWIRAVTEGHRRSLDTILDIVFRGTRYRIRQ